MLRIRTRLRAGATSGFTTTDVTNGTLVLNFVDTEPDASLSLDFTTKQYQQWANDTSNAGLIGYYKIKG